MNDKVDCNRCGCEFIVDEFRFGVMKKDDLVVRYFTCPACGERYHVFTSDTEMRKLLEKRKVVQMKIKAAFAKRFKKKTIRQYEIELDRIEKAQLAMMTELKRRGEVVLRNELPEQ